MRKLLLLVLPLASIFVVTGCNEDEYAARSARPAPSTQTASTSAQAYQPPRSTTTQPLPAGWGYINEKDLSASAGPLPPAAPVSRAAPAPAQPNVANSGG